MKCDFCDGKPVVWEYPCEDFEIVLPADTKYDAVLSKGSWMACEECHQIIENGTAQDLIKRSAVQLAKIHGPAVISFTLTKIATMQAEFLKRKSGHGNPVKSRAS